MRLIGQPNFGPYSSAGDATVRLSPFVNHFLGTDAGLIWNSPTGSALLRDPTYDDRGYGTNLVIRWAGPIAPRVPESPESSAWHDLEDALEELVGGVSRSSAARHEALHRAATEVFRGDNVSVSQFLKPVDRFIDDHPKVFDGVSAAFDLIGIVGSVSSVAAVFAGTVTLMPVLGLIAGVGCVLLLSDDGGKFILEVSGHKATAKVFKKSYYYEITEAIAPFLLVGDAVLHSPQIIETSTVEVEKVGKEIGTTGAELENATGKLAESQRSHLNILDDRPKKLPKMSAEDARLRRNMLQRSRREMAAIGKEIEKIQLELVSAQNSLSKASREIYLAETGRIGTAFAGGLYIIDPPDQTKKLVYVPHEAARAYRRVKTEVEHWQTMMVPSHLAQNFLSKIPHYLGMHVAISRKRKQSTNK